jgi:Protein of unknown function (DUF4089)
MPNSLDPARYVPMAASALGLPLAEEDAGDVIAAFTVLARVADVVMAFPLDEEFIAAAVFSPEEGRSK